MLITKADADEALHGQTKAFNSRPTISGSLKTSSCRHTTKTGMVDVKVYTPITAAEFEAGKGREEAYSEIKTKVETLSGIGEQSFIVGRDGIATIHVFKGNSVVQIAFLDHTKVPAGEHPDKSLKAFSETLKKLAIKAASRME